MKILRWSKRVDMQIDFAPGTSVLLCPEQEATEDQSFFGYLLKTVKESDMDYVLLERTEEILERRAK